MATINPVWYRDEAISGNVRLYAWLGLTENDTAAALIMPSKSDKTAQVEGTLGGGTLVIDGSLMPSAPTYRPLRTPYDTEASVSPAEFALGDTLRVILPNVRAVRPRLTGAVGASVNIYLLVIGS